MDNFELNIFGDNNSIKETFRFTDTGLTHAQNVRYKMLPFVANERDYVVDFKGVIGAFIRYMDDKSHNPQFNLDELLSCIRNTVAGSDEEREILAEIIENLFFKDDGLVIFNVKSLEYLKSSNGQEKVAFFLYSMFINENLKEQFSLLVKTSDDNIIYKLIFNSLPELKHISKSSDANYICLLPYVKDAFQTDFNYLMRDQELFDMNIRRLLEYYYMFYITQLAIKLSKFEKGDRNILEKVFMTLSWEITSKTRRAYEYGWRYAKEHIAKLFSHAVTLELLGHNNKELCLDYAGINELIGAESIIGDQIDILIEEYKKRIMDVDFTRFKHDSTKDGESIVANKVRELYEIIDFQFNESSKRKSAYRHYQTRFVEFVQINFGKKRGALGYNFNITEQDIILFTQIITGIEGGRIRLVKLFNEFEKRGLLFDRESKKKIVELFEKLNLLEKKSDSGDAQYVRSIL